MRGNFGARNCEKLHLSMQVSLIFGTSIAFTLMIWFRFHSNIALAQHAVFLCGAIFVLISAPRALAMPAPEVTDTPAVAATALAAPDEDTLEADETIVANATAVIKAPKSAAEKARDAALQEERRRQRNQREAELRELLMGYGVNERAAQDEIIRYIAHQTLTNEKLQRKGTELYGALRDNSVSEDRVYQLLSAYRLTLSRNRESRQKDEDQLNGRINFRTQPRLAALLELAGIIGDGPLNLPPPDVRRPNPPR